MDCAKIRPKLSAYLDNELNGEEKTLVSKHINQCAECRTEFDILGSQKEYLKKLMLIKPSQNFRSHLWHKIKTSEKYTGKQNRFLEKLILRWIPVPIVCSVGIILFSIFAVFSPLLYGITDNQMNRTAVNLAANTFAGCSMKNIFAPLNFIDFCKNCRCMLCSSCQNNSCNQCPDCK